VRPAADLAARLGLPIADSDLIAQALVHTSWLHEHPDAASGHNERLEFLGDAVVNLAISEALFSAHPSDDEIGKGLAGGRRQQHTVRVVPRRMHEPGDFRVSS